MSGDALDGNGAPASRDDDDPRDQQEQPKVTAEPEAAADSGELLRVARTATKAAKDATEAAARLYEKTPGRLIDLKQIRKINKALGRAGLEPLRQEDAAEMQIAYFVYDATDTKAAIKIWVMAVSALLTLVVGLWPGSGSGTCEPQSWQVPVGLLIVLAAVAVLGGMSVWQRAQGTAYAIWKYRSSGVVS